MQRVGQPPAATQAYLSTVIAATPRDLARAFGWPLAMAKRELL